MSDTDASWLAALVDGEGSILLRGPRVQIANDSRAILFAAQGITGVGTITPSGPGHWKWRTNSKAAAYSVIRAILPHLIIKRHLAIKALDAIS